MYKYIQLKIGDLLINVDNPRYEAVTHQREAIQTMLEEQKDKLVKLAEHIVEFGLSPIDIILVQPQDNLWLVKEGNRRITALKLLSQPDLVPDELPKIKRAFKSLAVNVDSTLLENIPCAYNDNVADINEWIRLKHTGENEGIGTVPWNAQQSSRFSLQTSNKPAPKTVFLEELRTNQNIPEQIRKQISKIHKTNFERLISDAQVRSAVGIEFVQGRYILKEPIKEQFLVMLSDLLDKSIKVGDIYLSSDRKKYLEELSERINSKQNRSEVSDKPDLSNTSSPEGSTDTNSTSSNGNQAPSQNNSTEDKSSPARKASYPVYRNTIIPSLCTVTIQSGRIKEIFNELKHLHLDIFPNASAVLFRVYVELTLDNYIKIKHIAGVNADSELNKKVNAVAQDFENKKIMTSNELKAARRMASSEHATQSIQTFHAYVHNVNMTPIPHDLCSAWNDIMPFIMKVWEVL